MRDEEVVELYKIAKSILLKYEKRFDNDYIQDLVTHLFSIRDKWNSSKGTITTFYFTCGYNFIKQRWRENSSQKRQTIYNEVHENYQSILELIPSNENLEQKLLKENTLESIRFLVNPLTMEYFGGAKQKDLASKYNCSQETISRQIKANIDTIRKYCKKNRVELKI